MRKAGTAIQLATSRLPFFSQTELTWDDLKKNPALGDFIEQVEVLVVHQASLSHLSLQAPKHVRVLTLLDEDKSRFAALSAQRANALQIRRFYRAVIERSTLVAVLTEIEREFVLRKAGLPASTAHVITVPLGVNVSYWTVDRFEDHDLQVVDVGVFGDLTYSRRVQPVEDAVKAAKDGGYGWSWRVAGRVVRPWLDSLEAIGVECTQAAPDLRPYYQRTRTVLVPQEQVPGMKSTLLEALVSGRPVVATEAAAVGTETIDGEHLLKAETARETVRRVAELLEDEKAAESLAHRGKEYALSEFDSNQLADRVVTAFESRV